MFKGKLGHIVLIHLYAMSQLEFDNCSLISIAMKVSSHRSYIKNIHHIAEV